MAFSDEQQNPYQRLLEEAEERVEAELRYLNEDDKWKLLEEAIATEDEKHIAVAVASVRVRALHDRVCPEVSQKEWTKAYRGNRSRGKPLGERIHLLRLVAATLVPRRPWDSN